MKKLFVMILMLGISLPVFAKEVKLVCTETNKYDGKISHNVFTFDEEKGTVGPYSIHTSCHRSRLAKNSREIYNCVEARISDIEISTTNFDKPYNDEGYEGYVQRTVLDRIDLKITEYDDETPISSRNSEEVYATGTCAPFKKAI
jgi:hypothetical protein